MKESIDESNMGYCVGEECERASELQKVKEALVYYADGGDCEGNISLSPAKEALIGLKNFMDMEGGKVTITNCTKTVYITTREGVGVYSAEFVRKVVMGHIQE